MLFPRIRRFCSAYLFLRRVCYCWCKSSVTCFACKVPRLQSKTSSSALLLTFTTHTQHKKREAGNTKCSKVLFSFFTSKKLLTEVVSYVYQNWHQLLRQSCAKRLATQFCLWVIQATILLVINSNVSQCGSCYGSQCPYHYYNLALASLQKPIK